MKSKNLIQIKQFCLYHEIENTFITELHNYGLIHIIIEENDEFLEPEQLPTVEKMIRMHYDLKINLEGVCRRDGDTELGSCYSKICGRKLRPWIEGKKERS